MSSDSINRKQLLTDLDRALRLASAQGAVFADAVAETVGINRTDMECLDVLGMNGPITAGRLAELTGLSTGAITGLVDRLERAGYVRRERDVNDRRRVIIHLEEQAECDIGLLFQPIISGMAELYSRYTDAELALVIDFTSRSTRLMQRETARLHDKTTGRAESA